MSQGAENIDHTTHPLLSALSTFTPAQTSYTYAFASSGETVDKGGYTGGDDFTRAWTTAEKNNFYDVVARYSEVSGLTFTEVASTSSSDLNLQMVDNVPGGAAGYSSFGGPTFVVQSASIGLLTHELGHSMWLDHPFEGTLLPGVTSTYDAGDNGFNSDYYTIMAYRSGTYGEYPAVDAQYADSLGAFDIAALQAMYGANQTANSGNDTYGISDDIWTIWDGAGTDIIDFSASTGNAVVDLRSATLLEEAGGGGWASFSDVDEYAVGAYTIAYGVVIENGSSGSGNDTVQGNDADNTLIAGLGDDTVYGGAGDDTIQGAGAGLSISDVDLTEMNTASVTNRSLEVSNFAMPGSVTVDMAVQLDAGTSHFQRILSYAPDAGTDVVLELQLWDDSSPYLYIIAKTGEFSLTTLWTGITKGELADGEVHRITLSRDATTGAYRIYLDGEFRNEEIHRAGEALPTGGDLSFGQSQGLWGSAGDPDYALKGSLGSIAVYDDVLSDAEIAARDVSDLADTADTRLVNYWVPDTGTGTITTEDGAVALTAVNAGTISTVDLDSDDDVLDGGSGDDLVNGYMGDDSLTGAAGKDTLNGAKGDDTLNGGAGADTVNGGDGDDEVNAGDANDLVTGGSGNDLLKGQYQQDTLSGGVGNDTLNGADGGDVLNGGNDDDLLQGGIGSDTLNGGDGNDFLRGQNQRDTLNGGAGDDTLEGGQGGEVFVFADNFGDDIITDFNASNAEDIDLSAVTAITGFNDLVNNHLIAGGSGNAVIVDGTESIILQGVTVSDIGAGLAYSEDDFIF